jgi:antitoxin (DNA-binding transcriptional repressor) of toxin-antitoxin stability system
MITVNLQEAKAKLNQLVDAAQKGEEVVLLRGSQVVATIMPLSPADLQIATGLSQTQAQRFWDEIESEENQSFNSTQAAVKFLKKQKSKN